MITKNDNFVIEQDKNGNYICRLKPELFKLLKQSYDTTPTPAPGAEGGTR